MFVAPAVILFKINQKIITLSVSTACTIKFIQFMILILFLTSSTSY